MPSANFLFLVIALWAGFLGVSALLEGPAVSHAQNFELVLSGEVAKKLPPRVAVAASTIGTYQAPYISTTRMAEDFPLELPFAHYKDRDVFLSFFATGPDAGKLFSVRLSSDLFDKPRRINVKLSKPSPKIRGILGWGEFRYTPAITKRMFYRELPFLDAKAGELVASPAPPVFELVDADGKVLARKPMGDGCMGSKWFVKIDDALWPKSSKDFILRVKYDSGGLFETIQTESKFRYLPRLHGP